MEGRVLKYHSGFYHVFHDGEQTVCKIRGKLKSGRKNTDIIAIGDLVKFEILPDGSMIDKVTTYDEYLENNAEARKRTVYVAAKEED